MRNLDHLPRCAFYISNDRGQLGLDNDEQGSSDKLVTRLKNQH